jgi:hypothetical protein
MKERFGMITDSQWADIDGNSKIDLVMAGDWMPIRVFLNKGDGKFVNATNDLGLSKTNGLWNNILIKDINLDGQVDILAGNAGSNFKWKPTIEKPVKLYLDDFDKNLQLDPIIFYNFFGEYVPFSSKDKLDKQLPYLKKKFPKYNDFSKVNNIKTLTGKSEKELIEIKYLYELRSTLFLKNENKFISKPLPIKAQLSSIEDFHFINDSIPKIIYVGNYHEYVTELGMSSANPGGILSGWNFDAEEFTSSKFLPLPLPLNARKILKVNNETFFVLSNNNYVHVLSKK